jgi:hypothetical protein
MTLRERAKRSCVCRPALQRHAIAAGLSATKSGFDLIKNVRELVKRPDIDPGEIFARLLELQDLMLDARTALSSKEDKIKFEARIAELTRMADFGRLRDGREGVYWRDGVPYCPICGMWTAKRSAWRTLREYGLCRSNDLVLPLSQDFLWSFSKMLS